MTVRSATPVRGVLLDLQGTLLAADGSAVPHAGDAVAALRAAGVAVRVVSNVDSVPPAELAKRLVAVGIDVSVSEVFSPVSAARRYLERQPGSRCFLLVADEIAGEFSAFRPNGSAVDHVLVGDCRDGFTYDRLNEALGHLVRGARLVALQKGRRYEGTTGPVLDTGAFVSALEYGAGVQAYVVGKPSAELLRMAIDDIGCTPYEALVVGDSLVSDVAGGHTVGARSVLVRTGDFSLSELERSERKPDLVLDSVADLPDALAELVG